jgi:hypothetical protein
MNAAHGTHRRIIFDVDMTADRPSMQEHGFIAYDTIVGDMGIGHEVIAIPDYGFSPAFDGPTMDCQEFPEDVLIPDFDEGFLSFIRKVLRLSADGRKGRKPARLSYFCFPCDAHMGFDIGVFVDSNVFPDYNIRADLDAGCQPGSRMNGSCGMDGYFPVTHSTPQGSPKKP